MGPSAASKTNSDIGGSLKCSFVVEYEGMGSYSSYFWISKFFCWQTSWPLIQATEPNTEFHAWSSQKINLVAKIIYNAVGGHIFLYY